MTVFLIIFQVLLILIASIVLFAASSEENEDFTQSEDEDAPYESIGTDVRE